ncbi:Uncharacterized membrane protein YcaP, DUF421 family [Thermoactinomyces sp. DSM 45891]|nr:Uncharacterized membrane protein YcaP, DUF421 family [Thermoactinomyces sp. DSM 45891]
MLWMSVLRTIFIYIFLFLMMRLMGKREIGKLSIFDLIVSFMIADLSAIVLDDIERPLVDAIVPILALVLLQIGMSYLLLKSRKARNLIEGEPTVIVRDGKIIDSIMAKSRYNLDDLLMQLREKDIPDVSDVEIAILETSGKLSVFPKVEKARLTKGDVQNDGSKLRPFRMPIPVIIEGRVQEQELTESGYNHIWLKQELRKKGVKDFKNVFYASVDQYGNIYIDLRDT